MAAAAPAPAAAQPLLLLFAALLVLVGEILMKTDNDQTCHKELDAPNQQKTVLTPLALSFFLIVLEG